jgi:ubiquinone/menaquinone biosynthesis C-methylase UbiE
MQFLKSTVKYIFQKINILPLLDKFNFIRAKWNNKKRNDLFVKNNPLFKLPSDYFLYETYRLNYAQYKEDGFVSAKEINEWSSKYLNETKVILEWGCGVSRIIRHYHNFINAESKLFACDINDEMTKWNKANIDNIQFDTISYTPPTLYKDNMFDFVYALSVFTHIEDTQQKSWIDEIARIIKPNGIFLFTTHGTNFHDKLSSAQLKELHKNGSYTVPYNQKGHRMMSTHNLSDVFKESLKDSFEVLEFYEGKHNLDKVGGQDLWLIRKK